MGEIAINTDFKYRISLLHKAIKWAPVEWALVWLCELIMISIIDAIHCSKTKLLKVNKERDTYYYSEKQLVRALNELGISEDNRPFYSRACDYVIKYRNAFVHGGVYFSKEYFDNLLVNKESVIKLAELVGVSLCFEYQWSDIIYRLKEVEV